MRPALLQPLFASLTSLSGIGEKTVAKIAKLLSNNVPIPTGSLGNPMPRIIDLLHFLPHSVIDRRNLYKIADLPPHKIATLEVTILNHIAPPRQRKNSPYKVIAADGTGEMQLVFFKPHRDWLEKQYPIGQKRIISGKVEYFNGIATISHPDYSVSPSERHQIPPIEPVYPLTAGISGKIIAKAIKQALAKLPNIPEWLDESILKQEAFPSYIKALQYVHFPQDPKDIEPTSPARKRLAYDEYLAGQLALSLVRQQDKKGAGAVLPQQKTYTHQIRQALPFQLTKGQEQSFSDIANDLANNERMLRLLQGDVGSGKTVVALLAMAQAAESHTQAALMAPTEILARQHYATIAPLAEKVGLKALLLTGREKGKKRQLILTEIANGDANFIIGTHALFQDDVLYQKLTLAIIDEQHRFGVEQRLNLLTKGHGINILAMTATPIPRSLILTAYGDMDLSAICEKPKGRKPIKTALLSMTKMRALLTSVKKALERGDKIYWICPLVEETEKSELTSATERYEFLSTYFGNKTGLVHGKMAAQDKDAVMQAFKDSKIQLLVATTVVEVGVDVRDASIIIIEHAERFGLAQLHQLRGRVGRGEKPSSCTLLYKEPLSKQALARLTILRESEDGFRLAEEDLRLRGEGDILGIRQSGMPDFCFADGQAHSNLLDMAAKHARLLVQNPTIWQNKQGEALHILLYLFRQNEALRLLHSG